MARQALSSPARKIHLEIEEKDVKGDNFSSVHILTKRLSIVLASESSLPKDLTASILRQVAQAGHLEMLEFRYEVELPYHDYGKSIPVPENVAKGLISVIDGNQNLKVVDFYCGLFQVEWKKYSKEVLAALKRNRGLRSINVDAERAIHNAYPVVVDLEIIGQFNDFNRFYRLTQETQVIRQSLLGETLSRGAVNNYQRSSMLLDLHTDTICELLHESLDSFDNLDQLAIEDTRSPTTFASIAKRPSRVQPGRAAKKPASNAVATDSASRE